MGAESIPVSPGCGFRLPPALAWSFRTCPPPRTLTRPGRWGPHTMWALNPGVGQPWGTRAHHSAPESVTTSRVLQNPGEEENEARGGSHAAKSPSANKVLMPPCTHRGQPASRGWGNLDLVIPTVIPTSQRAPARRKCNTQPPERKESPI